MKIQYIAVIFVVIILPIAMVMSSYIGAQIDTITLQTEYNTKLTEATYDAIKAFQINTVNNRYSTVSDSKIRDIEASINTFYSSLSSNEYLSREELQMYVPALVYTLYDGYYIYTKYNNMYPEKGEMIYTNANDAEANFGLKPYIYYSCRYNNSSVDFVVNYTLDNAITIYGTAANGKYITKSGYLINPNYVTVKNYGDDPMKWSLTYSNNSNAPVTIERELLIEHLLFSDETSGDYSYLTYNGQKIYYDKERNEYFTYQNYTKQYITSSKSNEELITYLRDRTASVLYSTSAFEYYYNAKIFSEEVAELTKTVSQKNAIDANGEELKFGVDTGTGKIFVANEDNDPLMSDSIFNENRMQVIKKSIESNLVSAIANYNIYSSNSYEFSLPILQETDWEKITNNVSVISFLQGLPIGYKYYNNYCVLTNNSNEETVKKENIYIITENAGAREYHLVGCKHLIEDSTETITATAYSNLSFLRQTVRKAENNYLWFYPQNRDGKTITACYNCIVNSTDVYSTEQILKGKITEKNGDTGQEELKYDTTNSRLKRIRELYIRALARERNDLYQANMRLINQTPEENVVKDKMRIIREKDTMEVDTTQTLIAMIGSEQINANWSSSDNNVATVDSNGKVTAKNKGEVTIRAEYNGTISTVVIRIIESKDEISILPNVMTVYFGDDPIQLTYTITPENKQNQTIIWTSSNNNVASVSNGVVTISKFGTATTKVEIKGTLRNGSSASCIITVKPKYLADVAKDGEYVNYKSPNGYKQWRVMSKTKTGENGIVTIISAGSPERITFKYPTEQQYISGLQAACNKYISTQYATSARNAGTTADGKKNSKYKDEINMLKKKGLSSIGTEYWIGFWEEMELGFCEEGKDRRGYYVNTSGDSKYYRYSGDVNQTYTSGIRPIITLKNKVIVIGGEGTKESPYEISIE